MFSILWFILLFSLMSITLCTVRLTMAADGAPGAPGKIETFAEPTSVQNQTSKELAKSGLYELKDLGEVQLTSQSTQGFFAIKTGKSPLQQNYLYPSTTAIPGNTVCDGTYVYFIVSSGMTNAGASLDNRKVVRWLWTTGAVDGTWILNVTGTVSSLALDGGETLYIAGTFSQVNGESVTNLCRCQRDSAVVDSTWKPVVGNEVKSVVVHNETVTVCGNFQSPRSFLAQFSTQDASLTAMDLQPNALVSWLLYDENYLYLAGSFTSISSIQSNGVARVAWSTSAIDPNFILSDAYSGSISAIALSDRYLYVGGNMTNDWMHGLIRFDKSTGKDTSWHPVISSTTVQTIGVSGNWVGVGGSFTQIDDTFRPGFSVFDESTGSLTNDVIRGPPHEIQQNQVPWMSVLKNGNKESYWLLQLKNENMLIVNGENYGQNILWAMAPQRRFQSWDLSQFGVYYIMPNGNDWLISFSNQV